MDLDSFKYLQCPRIALYNIIYRHWTIYFSLVYSPAGVMQTKKSRMKTTIVLCSLDLVCCVVYNNPIQYISPLHSRMRRQENIFSSFFIFVVNLKQNSYFVCCVVYYIIYSPSELPKRIRFAQDIPWKWWPIATT